MINNQEIKKVEGWARKVQPSCCYLKWQGETGKERLTLRAMCSNPDAKSEKCVYRNCPKVINNKID